MTAMHSKPGFTTASLNDWFHATLADPARSGRLKQDWIALLETDLGMDAGQRESLLHLPAKDAGELQAAIARVVDHGGTIRVERASEHSAGKLVVRPNQAAGTNPEGANPQFSIGIFHCTFDANFRHWHCGWGPG
jgi:hypothetical protein